MAKSVLKIQTRELRRKGLSINEIARKTGASKRSIGRWCQDIKLTPKQERKLWERANIAQVKNFKRYCEERKKRTIIKIEKLKKEGISEIGKVDNKQFFIAGVALYWAEGFKKDHRLGFASSDPNMIKFFLKWLKNCGVSKKNIRLRIGININYKNRTREIEKYWSKITETPLLQFNKPFYQKTVWKKEYEDKNNYYGVLRIRLNKSTDFLRKIKGWIEGLKANIEPA